VVRILIEYERQLAQSNSFLAIVLSLIMKKLKVYKLMEAVKLLDAENQKKHERVTSTTSLKQEDKVTQPVNDVQKLEELPKDESSELLPSDKDNDEMERRRLEKEKWMKE
jgi:hypothetical protein